jgi:hypothetical protein
MYCSKINLGTRCSLKMSKNMNKRATENYILKFLTVSSVSSDSIVKGIIDDIINFNKRKMQVKCISLFNLTRLCHVY